MTRGQKQGIRMRNVATREPAGHPSDLRLAASPCPDPWFSLGRDGPNAPGPLSGVSLISSEKTANAPIASRNSRHDQILNDQGRAGRAVFLKCIRHGHFPNRLARRTVQGNQMSVVGCHEYLVAE